MHIQHMSLDVYNVLCDYLLFCTL